jgi:pyridoxal phosphate enzyme (YggS family)
MLIGPQNSALATHIEGNLQHLRRQISQAALAAHRSVDSITVVAVSKGQPAERIEAAAAAGISDFGESYLQEALPKMDQLRALPARWHFIGRIQTNKTRAIAERFDWVHSVDRLKTAQRLSEQRPHYAAPLRICLQVNIAQEVGKAGAEPADVASMAQAVARLPRLQLRGLMCILPAELNSADNRSWFAATQALLRELNAQALALDTLSMGMSGDFEQAIAQGATLLRIGTAVFGPRVG